MHSLSYSFFDNAVCFWGALFIYRKKDSLMTGKKEWSMKDNREKILHKLGEQLTLLLYLKRKAAEKKLRE